MKIKNFSRKTMLIAALAVVLVGATAFTVAAASTGVLSFSINEREPGAFPVTDEVILPDIQSTDDTVISFEMDLTDSAEAPARTFQGIDQDDAVDDPDEAAVDLTEGVTTTITPNQ